MVLFYWERTIGCFTIILPFVCKILQEQYVGYIILSSRYKWFSICVTYVTKNVNLHLNKPIRVSAIVSVEYKATNTNVQDKNDMLVLFSFARCASVVTVQRQVVYTCISHVMLQRYQYYMGLI